MGAENTKIHGPIKFKNGWRIRTIEELCGDGFMHFIHRPKSKILKKLKSQRFGSWLCFRPQVNGRGRRRRKQSQLPKGRDFNFLIFLIFYSSDDG
jgi:hypothetical protein